MDSRLAFAQKESYWIERPETAEKFIRKVRKNHTDNLLNQLVNIDSGVLFHLASQNVNCIWHLMASRRYIYFNIEQFDIIQVTYHNGKDCLQSGLLWFLKDYSKYPLRTIIAIRKIPVRAVSKLSI